MNALQHDRLPFDCHVSIFEPATPPSAEMVKFCGQQFDVLALLGLSRVTSYRPHQISEFKELVRLLDGLGEAQVVFRQAGVKIDVPVFFSRIPEHVEFCAALQRMTMQTSWRFEFLPSKVNPNGTDVRVIVPD